MEMEKNSPGRTYARQPCADDCNNYVLFYGKTWPRLIEQLGAGSRNLEARVKRPARLHPQVLATWEPGLSLLASGF
jgi:hypothetical protein